jgi:hypothetical protein
MREATLHVRKSTTAPNGENQSRMSAGLDLLMLGPAVAGPPAERGLSYRAVDKRAARQGSAR